MNSFNLYEAIEDMITYSDKESHIDRIYSLIQRELNQENVNKQNKMNGDTPLHLLFKMMNNMKLIERGYIIPDNGPMAIKIAELFFEKCVVNLSLKNSDGLTSIRMAGLMIKDIIKICDDVKENTKYMYQLEQRKKKIEDLLCVVNKYSYL